MRRWSRKASTIGSAAATIGSLLTAANPPTRLEAAGLRWPTCPEASKPVSRSLGRAGTRALRSIRRPLAAERGIYARCLPSHARTSPTQHLSTSIPHTFGLLDPPILLWPSNTAPSGRMLPSQPSSVYCPPHHRYTPLCPRL